MLVPPGLVPDEEPDDAGSAGTDTVPYAIEYLADPTGDLLMFDDGS